MPLQLSFLYAIGIASTSLAIAISTVIIMFNSDDYTTYPAYQYKKSKLDQNSLYSRDLSSSQISFIESFLDMGFPMADVQDIARITDYDPHLTLDGLLMLDLGSNKYPMHVETDIKQLENDIVPPTTTHKPEIGTKTFSVSHTTLIEDEIAIYDQEKAHLSDSFLREADNQLLLPKSLPQNSPQQLSLDASETIDSSDGYSSYQHSLIPSPTNTSSVQSSVVFEVDDDIQSQNQSISEDFKDQSDCSSMSSWSLNNHVLIDSPILPVTLVSEQSVVLSTNLSESSEWEIPLNSSSN